MRRVNKRGFEFISNCVPVFFVAILLLSFFLARIIVNSWVNYAIISFVAVLLGRFIRKNREGNRFQYLLIAFAFISGYLAGHRAGSWFLILPLFIGVMVATNKIMKAVE